MLNIRPEQAQALSEANHRKFVQTMQRYVAETFPEDLAELGEDGVTEAIELGITIAAGYDIEIEREVGYYIDLMFRLDLDFDTRPEMAWAKKILERKDLTGDEKIARVRTEVGLQ